METDCYKKLRLSALEIATLEIGVREIGNNMGNRVGEYQKAALIGSGEPWCGAFVAWAYKHAAKATGIPCPIKYSDFAYTPTLYNKCKKIYSKSTKIEKCDLFFVYSPKMKRISHVGILYSDLNYKTQKFETVEGNTNSGGSREGDGVYKRTRTNTDNIFFGRIA